MSIFRPFHTKDNNYNDNCNNCYNSMIIVLTQYLDITMSILGPFTLRKITIMITVIIVIIL